MFNKEMLMTGFEPESSGVWNDSSAKVASTTVLNSSSNLFQDFCQNDNEINWG